MCVNCEVAFLSRSLGDLGVMYALHLYLIGKRVIDDNKITEHFS